MDSTERIKQRRADMPLLYRKLYDRCMAGKASPRDAIKMQCLECWAYVMPETANCDNCACPLFRYRPYQSSPGRRMGEVSVAEGTNRPSRQLIAQSTGKKVLSAQVVV